jgi:hypothetical protein
LITLDIAKCSNTLTGLYKVTNSVGEGIHHLTAIQWARALSVKIAYAVKTPYNAVACCENRRKIRN